MNQISKTPEVEALLSQWKQSSDKYELVQAIRNLILQHHPLVKERVMYGGIMFSLAEDFSGVFVSQNHVSLEFSQGFLLQDPKNILEGTGKFRRHLKIVNAADIKQKKVEFFIGQFS